MSLSSEGTGTCFGLAWSPMPSACGLERSWPALALAVGTKCPASRLEPAGQCLGRSWQCLLPASGWPLNRCLVRTKTPEQPIIQWDWLVAVHGDPRQHSGNAECIWEG